MINQRAKTIQQKYLVTKTLAVRACIGPIQFRSQQNELIAIDYLGYRCWTHWEECKCLKQKNTLYK